MIRSRKIPATVITGFLGAGKTSLIRHILKTVDGRRLALVINEFGDVGVDGELLKGCGRAACRDDDIVELANGCLCCTVADEFLPTIEALIERPEAPEHIVIETSGLALPKPLIKAFNWPEIRTRVTVDGVVAVIDAPAVAEDRFANDPRAVAEQRARDPSLAHEDPLNEVFTDQLRCADLVILNKTDLATAASLDRVERLVRSHLPRPVKVVRAAHAAVDAAVLLGLGAAAEDDLETRPSHHDGEEDDHDHDDFKSFTLAFGAIADVGGLHQRFRAVLEEHPVYRLKGFVAVAGKDMRHVVQAVGTRLEGYYDRPWRPDEPRQSRLTVIGDKGLDRARVAAAVGV
ncbi:MAG: cobalamin biosynthesis protein CobW [Alphaproteobacteria bacterium]